MTSKNPFSKTVKADQAYYTVTAHDWTWRVLKLNQSPAKALENPYASALCLVTSPFTGPAGDMGDTYISEIPNFRAFLRSYVEKEKEASHGTR